MKGKVQESKLKIVWKEVAGLSEEELQQSLDRAFDILFNEVEGRIDKIDKK